MLTWDPVSYDPVPHYELFWGTESGVYGEHVLTWNPPLAIEVEYDHYFAVVRACVEEECSEFSEEVEIIGCY